MFVSLHSKAQTLDIVAISNLDTSDLAISLLQEVYNRAGMKMEISRMPAQRALMESSLGRKDGELLRIFEIGEKYKTLKRVPTSLFTLDTAVFANKGSDVQVSSVSDLNNYSVAAVRGMLHVSKISKHIKGIHFVSHPSQLFSLLKTGRVDVVITDRRNGTIALKKHNIEGVHMVARQLNRFNVYHYLHESHVHLIPRIDKVIVSMKNSGELSDLVEKLELDYLNGLK